MYFKTNLEKRKGYKDEIHEAKESSNLTADLNGHKTAKLQLSELTEGR